jgi:SAM-dependent methyltransferase
VPSSEVFDHYEQLLADHYTWMFGAGFDDLVQEQRAVLEGAGVQPAGPDSVALDLGCGSGFQSVALAQMGYATVLAIDTSEKLLGELATHSLPYPAIRGVRADLAGELAGIVDNGAVHTAVCMGDTLTHLPDHASVRVLFDVVHDMLRPAVHLVLTFRDLSVTLDGLDRFLPVFGDANTVMLCFVESAGTDAVRVHDLVHRRNPDDTWTLHKSSYLKLRLAPAWVADQLRAAGFEVDEPAAAPRRMCLLRARKGRSA